VLLDSNLDKVIAPPDAAPMTQSLVDYKTAGHMLINDTVLAPLIYGVQQYLAHPYVAGVGGIRAILTFPGRSADSQALIQCHLPLTPLPSPCGEGKISLVREQLNFHSNGIRRIVGPGSPDVGLDQVGSRSSSRAGCTPTSSMSIWFSFL